MKEYKNQRFTGERALFKTDDAIIIDCNFSDGESPLKESSNLKLSHVTFEYKYPLWYGKNHTVEDSTFLVMSRSGLWYTNDSKFKRCLIKAPKEFRRCKNITIEDTIFEDASETLWTCDNVTLKNVKAKGDYLLKDSSDVIVSDLDLDGNYAFDGGKNIKICNSKLLTKDAFWNTTNVYIKDSYIEGEYFGWNSKNIVIENSTIISHQGFCYIDGLKMKNCKIIDSDLVFEYCKNLDCEIDSHIDSIKNPISGVVYFSSVGELILNEADNNLIHLFQKKEDDYEEIQF